MVTKNADSENGISAAIADLRSGLLEFNKLSDRLRTWLSDTHYSDVWDNLLISIKMLERVAYASPQKPELVRKYFNQMSLELERVADYCTNSGEGDTVEIIASMRRASKRLENLIS